MSTVCVDYCVAMYHMNKKAFELLIFDHFEKYCIIGFRTVFMDRAGHGRTAKKTQIYSSTQQYRKIPDLSSLNSSCSPTSPMSSDVTQRSQRSPTKMRHREF